MWGLAEATLGQKLHLLHVPLAGQIMIPIGIACALTARRLCPAFGIVMSVGAVAACARAFAPGPFFVMPSLAIALEAGLMEACLLLVSDRRRTAFTVAGAVAACYPLLHAFLIKTVFFGVPLAVVYAGAANQARVTLNAASLADGAALALWAAASLAIGAMAGLAVAALPSLKPPRGKAE